MPFTTKWTLSCGSEAVVLVPPQLEMEKAFVR